MDLFLAAGIEPDGARRGGRPGRVSPGSRRAPLFNAKVIEDAVKLAAFNPPAAELDAARRYAEMARNPKFGDQKETAVRNRFFDDVLGTLLGYRKYDPIGVYSLAFERPIRHGAVDVALGRFGAIDKEEVVAPFEMKGPSAIDLDAIPAGRGRSPVQQAWDYAIDAPGSRWVLVSNCVEIRLYGFGRGRDAFELFDLRKLDDPREHERLWLILSADRFLGGASEALLRETDSAYKAITNEFYDGYRALRQRLIGFLVDAGEGPKLARLTAIGLAQKLLDRILFIAFAQRTDLLPPGLLKRAAAARTGFDPKPVWHYIRNLFGFLDKGEFDLDITAYNGGLFAPDPVADSITVPDTLTEELVALGEWDYRRDVPVAVLGHIFEQSITDIEKERAESAGLPPPKVSKRKREGVIYTPDIVTRFLVEHTIGTTLAERFSTLLAEHAGVSALPGNGGSIPWHDGEASERAFWREYLTVLRRLTIVDPACGSGAFLVAAFDLLAAEYERVVEKLADLSETIDFDPMDEIVTRNLYGVDLNAESVEITRLSLWLRTARRKHRLQNLEATIKAGNSLIGDVAYPDRPFDWRSSFPEIFAAGGFDVVIGNPPYVRSETISTMKPWLKKDYKVYDPGADIYCYFYERGLQILKEYGRLGFISSCGFFKTAFGAELRWFIARNATIESGIDFGDVRIFEDVTTYPAVLTIRKSGPKSPYDLRFLNLSDDAVDLSAQFERDAFLFPSTRLSRSRWHFEPEWLWKLRDRIEKQATTTLSDISIPVSGIKSGLTEAFIIENETRAELIAADPTSAELFRPWIIGDDIARWSPEASRLTLIFIPKGWTKEFLQETDETTAWRRFQSGFPAIASWLLQFEARARKRSDKGDFWWELRACDYYELFDQELIIFPEMSQGPKFGIKDATHISNNKTFILPNSTPLT